MTPSEAISLLDDQLASGAQQTVTLQRRDNAGTLLFKADVPAFVRRSNQVNVLSGAFVQSYSLVIVSPTDLDATGWPGSTSATQDTRVPNRATDKVVMYGNPRAIQQANPFYMNDGTDNVLVRLEMTVEGP